MKTTRDFYHLQPGDIFKALVLDIRPRHVTIRLDGGGSFTARTAAPPYLRIGEESLFAVKENDGKGHIRLEMYKHGDEERQKAFDMRV